MGARCAISLAAAAAVLRLAGASAWDDNDFDEAASQWLPNRTELAAPCSRSVTRAVRLKLDSEILRTVRRSKVSLPSGCLLDPARDMYSVQEKAKRRRESGYPDVTWKCSMCGKIFKSEYYLDLHMERQHADLLVRNGVCFADYCEAFEVCQPGRRWREAQADCNSSALSEAKHHCEKAVSSCFPLAEESTRRLHAQFSRHHCQVIDCTIRAERRRAEVEEMVPVLVILVLVALVGFLFFHIVKQSVDSSDDIIQFLLEAGIIANGCARRLVRVNDQRRQAMGLPRNRAV
mmetsp:Transcript_145522/g.267449  ORF Transcript_145522/g.267449 Transcript_145522/m.267449 type:complete len:290 (-) Transcript_145522:64-933(-)